MLDSLGLVLTHLSSFISIYLALTSFHPLILFWIQLPCRCLLDFIVWLDPWQKHTWYPSIPVGVTNTSPSFQEVSGYQILSQVGSAGPRQTWTSSGFFCASWRGIQGIKIALLHLRCWIREEDLPGESLRILPLICLSPSRSHPSWSQGLPWPQLIEGLEQSGEREIPMQVVISSIKRGSYEM